MRLYKQFYVYVIRDPRPEKDNAPIYVGKGKGDRAKSHLYGRAHKNNLLRGILAKCRKLNLEPEVKIVARFADEVQAFEREVALIAKYGKRVLGTGTLCNMTIGGEGTSGLRNKASKQRMRAWWADPKISKQMIETLRRLNSDPKIREARIANLLRLNADPDLRKDRVRTLQRVHADPKFREACAKRLRELRADPAFTEAHAQRMRDLWQDPEWREKALAILAKVNADPKVRKGRSKAMRQHYADPEWKAKIVDAVRAGVERRNASPEWKVSTAARLRRLHTPEFREASARRFRALHSDPKFRKALLEGIRRRDANKDYVARRIAASKAGTQRRNTDPVARARWIAATKAGVAAYWAKRRKEGK